MARPAAEPAATEAPPLFAKRVVHVWLSKDAAANGQASWNRIARCGLALAGAAMVLSFALNSHVWWHSDSPEQLASESVMWLALPK